MDKAQLRIAIELLEHLGGDLTRLAELDDADRLRLVIAAGQVSRPDRYARAALGKAATRARKAARRSATTAVLDATGIRALRREPVFRTPLPAPEMLRPEMLRPEMLRPEMPLPEMPLPEMPLIEPPRGDEAGEPDPWAAAEALREPTLLSEQRHCYICKADFAELHHFYDQMCPPCAALNWHKRNQTADLRGRTVLITGARVKIGYQAAIKLLRAGAHVIVATRFPRDAARRYAGEPDARAWLDRLRIYGIDLRHTPSVERWCSHLLDTLPRLDGLINNACQTVRRPAGWYDHVAEREAEPRSALEHGFLAHDLALSGATGDTAIQAAGVWRSAVLAQVPLLAADLERGDALYPRDRLDQDLQQVDLRDFNSWRMTLADVPTAELLEVQLVNAIAPFVLNARLRPLLAAVPTRDAHVVNVSAMEGQFYRRWKTDKHPHTNMAKAALNMMTRTSAVDYVRDGIHMNSIDTGWVTDEDPHVIASRKTAIHGFHPPLDIVDGAARIIDPLFAGITTGHHHWGMFLKDYKPAPW